MHCGFGPSIKKKHRTKTTDSTFDPETSNVAGRAQKVDPSSRKVCRCLTEPHSKGGPWLKGKYRLNRPRNAEQGSRFSIHLRQRRRGAKNETFTDKISALIFGPDGNKGTLINFDKRVTVEPVLVATRVKSAFDCVKVESPSPHNVGVFSFEN